MTITTTLEKLSSLNWLSFNWLDDPKSYGYRQITKKEFEVWIEEYKPKIIEYRNGTCFKIDGQYKIMRKKNEVRSTHWANWQYYWDVELWTPSYGWETVDRCETRYEANDSIDIYRKEQPGAYRIKLRKDLV